MVDLVSVLGCLNQGSQLLSENAFLGTYTVVVSLMVIMNFYFLNFFHIWSYRIMYKDTQLSW